MWETGRLLSYLGEMACMLQQLHRNTVLTINTSNYSTYTKLHQLHKTTPTTPNYSNYTNYIYYTNYTYYTNYSNYTNYTNYTNYSYYSLVIQIQRALWRKLESIFSRNNKALRFKRGQRKCACIRGQILPTRKQ